MCQNFIITIIFLLFNDMLVCQLFYWHEYLVGSYSVLLVINSYKVKAIKKHNVFKQFGVTSGYNTKFTITSKHSMENVVNQIVSQMEIVLLHKTNVPQKGEHFCL